MKDIINKIVDKKFESVINGYSPSSVDIFLDSIIKELLVIEDNYRQLINEKQELIDEKNILIKQNEILEKEIKSIKQIESINEMNSEISDEINNNENE